MSKVPTRGKGQTREIILERLIEIGTEGLTAKEIAETAGIGVNTVPYHLEAIEKLPDVHLEKIGNNANRRYYATRDAEGHIEAPRSAAAHEARVDDDSEAKPRSHVAITHGEDGGFILTISSLDGATVGQVLEIIR